MIINDQIIQKNIILSLKLDIEKLEKFYSYTKTGELNYQDVLYARGLYNDVNIFFITCFRQL